MARLNSFRELQVWQRGMDVVEAVYRAPFIAEGHTRESTAEYLRRFDCCGVPARQLFRLRDALMEAR